MTKTTVTKRLLALSLALILLFSVSMASADTVGDRLHFIATNIRVTSSSVRVEGYFVNLNTNYYVKNFNNFKLYVYYEGSLILSGSFGTINQFSVPPLGYKYQSFTWYGRQGLNIGTYSCDDAYNCRFTCKYKKYR